MNLDAGHGALSAALKTLAAKWDGVEPFWQDAMKQQFVEKVWEPLLKYCNNTLEAIDQMQVILVQMKRDCEDASSDVLQGD